MSPATLTISDHLDAVMSALDELGIYGPEGQAMRTAVKRGRSALDSDTTFIEKLAERGGDPLASFRVKAGGWWSDPIEERLVNTGWVTITRFGRDKFLSLHIGNAFVTPPPDKRK
jgi:hypothetical protein